VLILSTVAIIAGPRMQVVPSGFSGVIEAIVSGFYSVVAGVVGEVRAREFFWVIATIFFYIITSNYFGLLPGNFTIGKPEVGHGSPPIEIREASIAGFDVAYVPFNPAEGEEHHDDEAAADDHAATQGLPTDAMVAAVGTQVGTDASVTLAAADPEEEPHEDEGTFGILAPYLRSVNTDVNTPLAIAIYSFIFVEFWGLRNLGLGYLGKFFSFGRLLRGNPMGLIDVFVGFLELVSEISRIMSFTFRLFGNIFAGEVLLVMMGFLVPLVLIDVFYGLELFVGAIQAFVFAMLTLVFAQTAVSHHGDEHEEGHGAHP
jgi:F-type H+-transporting ATPase subunit a